jgi:hypothetical protein
MLDLREPARFLCHYTRAETAFANIVPTGKLMMNPYSQMRDPFENKEPGLRSLTGFSASDEGHMDMFTTLQDKIARARDGWVLLSLTRFDDTGEADEPESNRLHRAPWARPRLWEQYADNHAGVCLVFDREKMTNHVSQSLVPGVSEQRAVQYTLGGFATSQAPHLVDTDFRDEHLTLEVLIQMYVQKHSGEFFFLKTADWSSEWEYRFIFRKTTEHREARTEPFFASYGDTLRAIVVGERFPTWQLPAARKIADEANAELRQMSWVQGWPLPAIIDP